MADFEGNVFIGRPVARVYEFVSSMENMPEFNPNIVKIEKPHSGLLKPGDRVIETRMIRGREIDNELEIIENIENKLFSYRSNMNGLEATYRYIFNEADGGTNAQFEAHIKTSGLRMRLTKRLIVDMLKREDGNQMKYLKDVLEGAESPV